MASKRAVKGVRDRKEATEAILLAGGLGSRLGEALPKAMVSLCGVPMVVWAARALFESGAFLSILPVLPAKFCSKDTAVMKLLSTTGCRLAISGGRERQDSMGRGLKAVNPSSKWVAIHDAARPLVDPSDVFRVVEAAQGEGAAILGSECVDTIKKVDGDRILATESRSGRFLAQTPQVFREDILLEAWEKAERDKFLGTDDAQLVERLGVAVTVVHSSTSNRKVTYKDDLVWAEAVLNRRQDGGVP